MESVLILGAASLQVPLIKYVKSQGYKTIVVSIPGPYEGFQYADRCIYEDIRDYEAIIKAVKGENIVSVLTDQTDISVPTVSIIAEQLGLAGNCVDVAKVYSNKFLMREACLRNNVSVPSFIRVASVEDVEKEVQKISFPAIMKPEDNQGSRGIYILHGKEDVISNLSSSLSYSKTGYAIIEEFFVGKEFVCEGFVIDGKYVNWGVGERCYFDIENKLIPCQTIFPSKLSDDVIALLIEAERRLHSDLNPSFGMIHSEYLVNEETKEYILVETALRGGGVYISSHLIPMYTQYNNYELLFNCSLGKKMKIEEIESRIHPAASAYVCFSLPEGVIVSITGIDKLEKLPFVKKIDLQKVKIGIKTNALVDKTDRLGPIIIEASDRQEIERHIKEVQETLIIETVNSEGVVKGIIWN